MKGDLTVIALLCLLSTSFFLYQGFHGMSWDFIVYSLNGDWLFHGGHYFEWERPPLIPAILAFLRPLGFAGARMAYIMLASLLFCGLIVRLGEKTGVGGLLLYAIILNPMTLNLGFFAGGEILTLSLLTAAILRHGKSDSGFYWGLATLARYTSAIYLPMMACQKSIKKTIACAIAFSAVWIPWICFNQSRAGHPFYSVASSFLLNVQSGASHLSGENAGIYILWLGFFGMLAMLGILKRRGGWGAYDTRMLAFGVLSSLAFIIVSVKEWRYLLNLWVPIAYFAGLWLKATFKDIKPAVYALVALNFIVLSATPHIHYGPGGFERSLDHLDWECQHMSNGWPYLNGVGLHAQPLPHPIALNQSLEEGKRIIIYEMGQGLPEHFDKSMILYSDSDFAILGLEGQCKPKGDVIISYVRLRRSWGEDIVLCPILPFRC
jgi:hypothetical protein